MTPEGWRAEAVGDLGEIAYGLTVNGERRNSQRLAPYLTVANLQANGFDLAEVKEIGVLEGDEARYALARGDVLLVEGNANPERLGNAALWESQLPFAMHQNHLIRVRPNREHVVPEWLVRALNSSHVRGQIAEVAKTSSGLHTINSGVVRALHVAVPPLPEQRKIASILSSVDGAIEATRAVIDQLGVVKRAMMAELLTRGLPGRHTRFKQTEIGEVPEAWDVVPLDALAAVQTGIAKGKVVERGVELPYLRVANVQDGHVDVSEMKSILVEEAQVERYRLRAGDVLFTEGGDADKLGRGCVWRGQIDPCLHQNHVFAVRSDRQRLLPEFLAYWAAGPRGKGYFLDCAKQTTNLASINSTQLKAFPVPLMPIQEQGALVAALRLVDDRIAVDRETLAQLKVCKSALMSVLLTGEVRVKPDEEAA